MYVGTCLCGHELGGRPRALDGINQAIVGRIELLPADHPTGVERRGDDHARATSIRRAGSSAASTCLRTTSPEQWSDAGATIPA